MKRLKDGDEDDVVGYQPEGYDDMTRITKRATNQSALGIGVVVVGVGKEN